MQPITVEVDTGSASSWGRLPERSWLVRLRRRDQNVITTIGLSRTSGEQLAAHITDVLAEPDKAELVSLLGFYAGWLEADRDYARGRVPFYGTCGVSLF